MKRLFYLVILLSAFAKTTPVNAQDSPWISKENGDIYYNQGNVGIGATNSTPWKLQVESGAAFIQMLNSTSPNGHGDLFRIQNIAGRAFSVNAYNSSSNVLVTHLGNNYAIDGSNSLSKYAIIGAKKAPIIELNAETGSISLYGESGTGNNYRRTSHNLGVSVNSTGNVGIGTLAPKEKLHINGNLRGHLSKGAIKIQTDGDGYLEMGPQNSQWCHFYTDRPRYYFNKRITVDEGIISSYDENLQLQTQGITRMTLNTDGNVGIGAIDPNAKLHIINSNTDPNGSTLVLGPTNASNLRLGYHADYSWIQSHNSKPLYINKLGNNTILNADYGNVGIGTTSPDYKLDVDGTIRAHEIIVNLNEGADYVFAPDYNLRSLDEVETFINENKHLPDVPSADEYRKNGASLSEMNNLLLQKVEELTLYMIEQQKNSRIQAAEIDALRNEVAKLKGE